VSRRYRLAVLIEDADRARVWLEALRRAVPDWQVDDGRRVAAADQVDFVVLWGRAEGLSRFTHLRAILSLGAGVDHVLRDPDLPREVPLIRMVDPGLACGMVEYVSCHVLRHHLGAPSLERSQREQRWTTVTPQLAHERTVGIMGLGAMGSACATRLTQFGFQVVGWSRTRKSLAGVTVHAGRHELPAFLARSEILVCLLPLTEDTRDILDAGLCARLPRGAAIINAARGEHLVEDDLLAALDAGQISGATLDVFRVEPLPQGHPFWQHPCISVTPHVASLTRPGSGAQSIVRSISSLLAGESPPGLVNQEAGY